MQKEGIWFPISKINSGQHLIKLEGYDNTFNDEWEQKFEIEGFNLKIEGGLWISDIGSFYTFNEGEFCGEAISFKTGDGDIQYSDFKYDVPAGKYLLSVKQRCTRGYKRYKETSGLIEWKECQIFHSIFT